MRISENQKKSPSQMKQLFRDYSRVSGFNSEQSQHNSHLHNSIPGFNPKAQRCFSHVPELVCAIKSWTLQEQSTDIFLFAMVDWALHHPEKR